MEAPPTRYRVVEKDGRLIVIDTAGGGTAGGASPIRPSLAPAGRAAPVMHGKGTFDSFADALAALTGKGRDAEGRLLIAWEWTRNGKRKRWNAALDPGQQRRLGRALIALGSPVPLVLLAFVSGWPFAGFLLALPLILSGAIRLNRLQRETDGPARLAP